MALNRNTFQALSDTEVFVLNPDGNLWLEHAPFGHVPPARQQVDRKVEEFRATADIPPRLYVFLRIDAPQILPKLCSPLRPFLSADSEY